MQLHRQVLAAAALSTLLAFSGRGLVAQSCPLAPFEPPLPEVGVPLLPSSDTRMLDDFGAALAGFRGLPVDEFLREFGPRKAYRPGGMLATGTRPPAFVRGDANGDGAADLSDAVCTLAHLFLGGAGVCASPACLDPHDTDDDGAVEITDPIALLQHLFRGGPPPRPPFPLPGTDATPDNLPCAAEVVQTGYDPFAAEYVDAIRGAYPLSPEQEEAFQEHGFVILGDQRGFSVPRFDTFVNALFDVFERRLPVYFSADALLDALHQSFDAMLKAIEEDLLVRELDSLLSRMETGIAGLEPAGANAAEVEDVAWWLCAARSLLAGEKVPCARPVDGRVEESLAWVAAEQCIKVEILGNVQVEDFSQFKPRSHYAETEQLQRYFRAMMWVQRLGTKFAQLPRHAAAAYHLARLLNDTGAAEHWQTIDEVVRLFVGTSDSLNPPGMIELAASAGIASAADLRDGDGFLRLVRRALETGAGRQLILSQVLRSNPTSLEGFTPIPPAFHLLGQRFIIDSFALTNVVFDRVCCERTFPRCLLPCRWLPSPLDAWFALGNRAALPLLESEVRTYEHQANLAALDWLIAHYPEEFWSSSLYSTWLSALRELNADTTGPAYPAVMQTAAWDRRMLHTQLASWAHLRHDTLLYGKPSYGAGDCFYPDGWVDPYPEFYAAVAAFAETALSRLEDLRVFGWSSRGYRVRKVLDSFRDYSRRLERIARAELAGQELNPEQVEFLRSILKPVLRPGGGSQSVPFDGWYFDLIFEELGVPGAGMRNALLPTFKPTIADVHTDPNPPGRVLHVGVARPNLMLISVKNDCATKAYVGPVLSYYEVVREDLHRMTDQEWEEMLFADENLSDHSLPRPDWVYEFVR